MPRSELSETYDRPMNIVGQLLGLNEEERGFVLDRVAPMPEPEQAAKKSRKKTGRKSGSKSSRASSLGATIKGNLDQRRTASDLTNDPSLTGPACTKEGCDWKAEDLIHDPNGGYAGYHEFQPAGKSTAPSARGRSSTNGGAMNGTVNSADETVSAGAVVGGSSE